MFKIVIHGRLPGMNEYINACRRNKYAANNMKKKSEKMIIDCIKNQLGNVKFDRKIRIIYNYYEINKRRDLDNIAGYTHKVFQDSLTKSNVLKNDGWNEIAGFRDNFYVDKKNPRIEIEIEIELVEVNE